MADNLLISSKKRSSSSTNSSDDNALAEYRIEVFMSDVKTPANATLVLKSNRNVTASAIKLAAEKRIAAELLAFDNAFDQSTTRTT
jgi:hypothetical protein